MLKTIILIFVIMLNPIITFNPQSNSSKCNSEEFHQFDFWIGEWDINQKIIQKDGSWLETSAQTSVTSILNGCALEEHWKGDVRFFWLGMEKVETMEGFSFRYYNEKEKVWYLYWIDELNLSLGSGAKGKFENGKGEFFSENSTPNGKRMSRITFSNITENSVDWDLAISEDNGENWTTIWVMEMVRSGK